MPVSWQNSPDCSGKFFISRERQGYVPETGKQAVTGHILFSGDSDGAGSPSGTARHPVFREYFQKKQEEGKNKQQR